MADAMLSLNTGGSGVVLSQLNAPDFDFPIPEEWMGDRLEEWRGRTMIGM